MKSKRPNIAVAACIMHEDPQRPLFKGKALLEKAAREASAFEQRNASAIAGSPNFSEYAGGLAAEAPRSTTREGSPAAVVISLTLPTMSNRPQAVWSRGWLLTRDTWPRTAA